MWLILDLASFKSGKALPPGFFVIVEEIPSMIRSYDATPILGFGAFTSYNIPCVGCIRRRCSALHPPPLQCAASRLLAHTPCHAPPDSILIS